MTESERQDAVVHVLIFMEPAWAHDEGCSGRKNPKACKCYLIRNCQNRAAALDEAGLLRKDNYGTVS